MNFRKQTWLRVLNLIAVLTLGLGAFADPIALKVTTSSHSVRFSVQGAVQEIRVEIFSLTGQKIFDSGSVNGAMWSWPMLNREGQPVANGVYLYSVTVTGPDGNLGHRMGKLALPPQRPPVSNSLPQREPSELPARQFQPLSHKDTACSTVLQPYVDWMVKKPQGPGDYSIGFTLVSNSSNNVATFAEGRLSYFPATPKIKNFPGTPARFESEGKQYFSDKRWGGSGLFADPNPFDPNQTQTLKVRIDISTAKVTLTKGNTTIASFNAHCAGGMLYGMPQALGRGAVSTMYVISLSKGFVAIPK